MNAKLLNYFKEEEEELLKLAEYERKIDEETSFFEAFLLVMEDFDIEGKYKNKNAVIIRETFEIIYTFSKNNEIKEEILSCLSYLLKKLSINKTSIFYNIIIDKSEKFEFKRSLEVFNRGIKNVKYEIDKYYNESDILFGNKLKYTLDECCILMNKLITL